MDRNQIIYQIEQRVDKHLEEIGVTTAAAAVGVGVVAKKIYDTSMDVYNKALAPYVQCRRAENKRACVRSFRIRALQSQKRYLISGRVKCDSRDCYSYLDGKVRQIDAKLGKLT